MNSSGMESSLSLENVGKPFEKPGCLSETSRSSGLLVTIPELIHNLASMRYGFLAEEFYKINANSETVLNIENEQCVPSSSLSKLFINIDNEIRYIDCQRKSFYMRDKFYVQNSAKSIEMKIHMVCF